MRRVSKLWFRISLATLFVAVIPLPVLAQTGNACSKPIYLTLDTGHMEVAGLIAEVLQRQKVQVTFFAAHEKTRTGDGSLGAYWAPWWRERAAEGHAFASHTLDHVYWLADIPGPQARFRVKASAGANPGQEMIWSAKQYCDEVRASAQRLELLTGQRTLPLFRAPGGKTSPSLLAVAQSCGYKHVGWSAAGFLGDELDSDKFSNEFLLKQALRKVRSGDVLMAHLGIWSRKDPWAPAVLEPLIVGLKERGFCFSTLKTHPDYQNWIAKAVN